MFVGPHHGGQGCPVPGRVGCGLTRRSEQVGSMGTGKGREWDGTVRIGQTTELPLSLQVAASQPLTVRGRPAASPSEPLHGAGPH